MSEKPIALAAGEGTLAGSLYAPEGEPVGAVLLCNALFEERKSSGRVMVSLARALSARGYCVLRFDYRGCGDSAGDFESFTASDWCVDIRAAARVLRAEAPGVPFGVVGLRLGANLAACALGESSPPAFLVLWEPVVSGAGYMEQELRRKLVREMVTFGKGRGERQTLRGALEAGDTVDLDGYAVTPALYSSLETLNTGEALGRLNTAVLVVSISHSDRLSASLEGLRETLEAGPGACAPEILRIVEQPFWSLVGLVPCVDLIDRTGDWITAHRGDAMPGPDTGQGAVRQPDSLAECPIEFTGRGGVLRGVLHRPAGASCRRTGLVFLHGWSGCRLGPHRMFVEAARRYGAQGFACLRFDFRGRGDSAGRTEETRIASMAEDAVVAAATLREQAGVESVVLVGLCSGSKVAVTAAAGDSCIDGLALWSAEAMGPLRARSAGVKRSVSTLGTYFRKLTHWQTWRKLLTFRVNTFQVAQALNRCEVPDEKEREEESAALDRFKAFRGRVLFVYGGRDPAASALEGYTAFCTEAGIPYESMVVDEANHSFYSLASSRAVLDRTEAWLLALPASGEGAS